MLLLNLLMMLPLPHNSQFPILSIAQVQKQMFLELQPKIKNSLMFLELQPKIKNCLPCPALPWPPCPTLPYPPALFVRQIDKQTL
jgi:hypothetical protein